MREYDSADLRNVAVIGHGRTGKTTLLDACLYKSGAAKRFGKPSEKTSAFDVEPEEIRRGLSIVSSLAALEVQGCKLNLLDTPGYPDFIGEEAAVVLPLTRLSWWSPPLTGSRPAPVRRKAGNWR